MKKILFALFTLIMLAMAFIWVNESKNLNNEKARIAYEQMLHEAMQTLPAPGTNLKDIPKADRPDVAAIQNYFQTLDPHLGYVPIKRQYAAYLQTLEIEQMRGRSNNIFWEGTRADMGGRTRAMMFDPNDGENKRVFAAGVTGGLWYTNDITNLNEDWFPVDDFWPNLAISSLAYDPTDPLVFYAGTGEAQTARVIYRESSGLGMGIMKSNDGGYNWEIIPSTMDFAYVTDVKVRNENGVGVIYAAVVSGFYQGNEHQSAPSDGLYRSADGGLSWEQVLPEIPGQNGAVYAPAMIELASNNRIFVGTMENLDLKGGAVVLHSDLGTAGSWSAYTNYNTLISAENYYNIPARTIVAASPSNPDVVYAQFSAGYTSGFNYYRGRYMARSTDGGQTWSPIPVPSEEWSTLAWHAFILKVDPLNPAVVYTGGLDLWKSSNNGQSWTKISDWVLMYYGGGDEYVHADQHNILFRPDNPQQAIFASDGGVFLSTNAHLSIPTFVERNQNFNTLQFYSCAINPLAGSQQFLGGLQDNGSLKFTEETLTINDMVSGGDGAYCFWDQDEPNLFITSVYYNRYYIFKNNALIDYIDGGNGTFVSPVDYDWRDNTLYANAVSFAGSDPGRLFKISGIGSPESSNAVINLGTMNTIPFSHIKLSQHSPANTANLFVGTQSGRLYKVVNAQSVPIVTDIGSVDFPTANISSVSIAGSEDTLLVSFSNYGVSSVWQTYDGGQNWHEKEGNLPDMPIRWAMYHPLNSGQVMLATETGIWTTNMFHEASPLWEPANEGMGNVRVDMLQYRQSDQTVIAASHGRGMFTTIWEKDVYTGKAEEKLASLKMYPNPVAEQLHVSNPKFVNGTAHYIIYDIRGAVVDQSVAEITAKGEISIPVSSLIPGSYILKVEQNQNHFEGRFMKR